MQELLNKVEAFVSEEFKKPVWKDFDYHNSSHTLQVVEEVRQLGKLTKLSDTQMFELEIAAWFHDLGYSEGVEGHENISASIAENYLKEHSCPPQTVESVKSLIYATNPSFTDYQSISQKLIRDADLSNAGLEEFIKWNSKLRKEWSQKLSREFTDNEWEIAQYEYLNSLKYLSEAAKARYNKVKEQNLDFYKGRVLESDNKSTKSISYNYLFFFLFLLICILFFWLK